MCSRRQGKHSLVRWSWRRRFVATPRYQCVSRSALSTIWRRSLTLTDGTSPGGRLRRSAADRTVLKVVLHSSSVVLPVGPASRKTTPCLRRRAGLARYLLDNEDGLVRSACRHARPPYGVASRHRVR